VVLAVQRRDIFGHQTMADWNAPSYCADYFQEFKQGIMKKNIVAFKEPLKCVRLQPFCHPLLMLLCSR
jgi:hypothetical protein